MRSPASSTVACCETAGAQAGALGEFAGGQLSAQQRADHAQPCRVSQCSQEIGACSAVASSSALFN
jgi:hypothetical protein